MSTRICVLGLPRCGSHYVVELIIRAYGSQLINLTDLKEPFSLDDPVRIQLTDGLLSADYDATAECGQRQFKTITEQIDNRLNLLSAAHTHQDLILRLFPFDYITPYFASVVDQLKKLNFNFIALERSNIEEQLLSYGRSVITNVWIGGRSDTVIEYDDRAFTAMRWLSDRINSFGGIIEGLDIQYDRIIYESAVDDLTELLGVKVGSEVTIKKQRIDSPYDVIANSQRVKDFLRDIGRRP